MKILSSPTLLFISFILLLNLSYSTEKQDEQDGKVAFYKHKDKFDRRDIRIPDQFLEKLNRHERRNRRNISESFRKQFAKHPDYYFLYMDDRNDDDYSLEWSSDPFSYFRGNKSSGNHNSSPNNITTDDTIGIAWIRTYGSGNAPGNEEITDIEVDNAGNLYVTGFSTNPFTGASYHTIKYDANGNEVWSTRYDGDGSGMNYPLAIGVDNNNNVYVTGYSFSSATSFDYATVKYNSSGVQQWVVKYNGPDNGADGASKMFIDGLNNLYVSGISYSENNHYDIVTIKYNNAGTQIWSARYDGPYNWEDDLEDLAVDGSDNVYITGGSELPDNYIGDCFTVKYNSSGSQLWAAVYDASPDADDKGRALAVDIYGNVYVTGRSETDTTYEDIVTIKYNSQGVEQWVNRYNGEDDYSYDEAAGIALDNAGNIYVTGSSENADMNGNDITTIKYTPNGEEQWIAFYDGPDDYSYDYASDIVVDNYGNIFVCGECEGNNYEDDYVTIKYNSNGQEQWSNRYDGPSSQDDDAHAIAIDGNGNVYVGGESEDTFGENDFAALKYNSGGTQQWVARYDGPGNSLEAAYALAVDNIGNVYVAGRTYNKTTDHDLLTIKYDPLGNIEWSAMYIGSGTSEERPVDIAVDDAGNVYVTGNSEIDTEYEYTSDYVTIKYNASGSEQWVAIYDGPINGYDEAAGLGIDDAGNVYVTGSSESSGYYSDYATVKYNQNGVEQWVARYDGTGNDDDDARAIAVDGYGNVYVTGESYMSGQGDDFVTVKYNSAGVEQWVARYDGTGNDDDDARAIAVDDSGNVYVTGESYGSGTSDDFATVKYNSNGVEQWAVRYNSPLNESDNADAIAVDNSGNVYVAGDSEYDDGNDDMVTIKYNANGVEQWVNRYDGGYDDDRVYDMTLDQSGNVYVFGSSVTSNFWEVYCTIRYNPGGEREWIALTQIEGSFEQDARAIVVDNQNNVIVTGDIESSFEKFATVKYYQGPVSIEDFENKIPKNYSFSDNYPNPFNPVTTIDYSLPELSNVKIEIFNVSGQKIKFLENKTKPAGKHKVMWNAGSMPTGIYFAHITCRRLGQGIVFSQNIKMILLK